jgi:hypothetical protein
MGARFMQSKLLRTARLRYVGSNLPTYLVLDAYESVDAS